jgi:hypothetical protein
MKSENKVEAEKCESGKNKMEVQNLGVNETERSEERSGLQKNTIWNEGIDIKAKCEETQNIEGEDRDADNQRFRG